MNNSKLFLKIGKQTINLQVRTYLYCLIQKKMSVKNDKIWRS